MNTIRDIFTTSLYIHELEHMFIHTCTLLIDTHQFSLLTWSPNPGVSVTVRLSLTPPSVSDALTLFT